MVLAGKALSLFDFLVEYHQGLSPQQTCRCDPWHSKGRGQVLRIVGHHNLRRELDKSLTKSLLQYTIRRSADPYVVQSTHLYNIYQIFTTDQIPLNTNTPCSTCSVCTINSNNYISGLAVLNFGETCLYEILPRMIKRIFCDVQRCSLIRCFKRARNGRKDYVPE